VACSTCTGDVADVRHLGGVRALRRSMSRWPTEWHRPSRSRRRPTAAAWERTSSAPAGDDERVDVARPNGATQR